MTQVIVPHCGQRTRKLQQRSIVTQNKLLDAAIAAFSENGFKGTSTRDIADRAGVHHPLISYHFSNKDRLWRAAADKVFGDFKESLTATFDKAAEHEPKVRMATMIRAYLHYARRRPALYKVMVLEAAYPSPRLNWLIENHLQPLFDRAFELIEELQQTGMAPNGNPKLLFNMIRVCSGGLLALGNELRLSSSIDIDDDETLDEIVDMIVQLFLPGDSPHADATR
ncbi:MAG: TetR/AcrR family transcriptional regulator [Woeseiaceae bacterium]